MRALGQVFSWFALLLLQREWRELESRLRKVYGEYISDPNRWPPALAQQLLISGEDHRFFRHRGIDPIAICRSIWRGVVLGRREGASTIEMQVVRVVSGRFE